MRALVRRHTLVAFFVLAFALSWYPWIIALVGGRTSGPNPFGPFGAAVIIAALGGGKSELQTLLAPLVRARVGWRWYIFIFGLPILICLAAVAIVLPVFGLHPALPVADHFRELPERFIFTFLFIGLGEEPGWRGFALPHLQEKNSALIASLILAPLWALWHLPLMGNEFPWPIVPAFLLSLFGATFMLTWLFNRTEGSVLLPMFFHATVNTVGAGSLFQLFSGTPLVVLWYVYGAIWFCAGLGAILLSATALTSDR